VDKIRGPYTQSYFILKQWRSWGEGCVEWCCCPWRQSTKDSKMDRTWVLGTKKKLILGSQKIQRVEIKLM